MLAMAEKNRPDVYYIRAEWDTTLRRWSAVSDDIPGLFLETDTFEALTEAIDEFAPQLIELNGGGMDMPDVPIFVQAHYSSKIRSSHNA